MAGRLVKEFTKGLWKDLPPFRLVLGLCAVLAVTKSASNGLGMGLGFTLTLVVMGSIREVLGQGTLFGVQVLPEGLDTMAVFSSAPGGFFVFGVLMALVAYVEARLGQRTERSAGCAGCPSASMCESAGKGGNP